ncbi:MAG: glycine cleavage T C-terminal barrel domain-containing protein, partial [Gammaproteobacteria bacterium]
DTPIDVGMMSTVKMQKSAAFLGHKALTERLATPPNRLLASFRLLDEKKMLYGTEPLWREDELCGYITSAGYGHSVGGAVGLGVVAVDKESSAAEFSASSFEIEVAGQRFDAQSTLKAFYDPDGHRLRS